MGARFSNRKSMKVCGLLEHKGEKTIKNRCSASKYIMHNAKEATQEASEITEL